MHGGTHMANFEQSIHDAIQRGNALDLVQPRAVAVRVDTRKRRLVLDLDNQAEIAIPFALLPSSIASAEAVNLAHVNVEGAGHDLYWPDLDEGLYIPDLCAKATFGELAVAA